MYVIVQKDTRIKIGISGKPDLYGAAKKFSTKRKALEWIKGDKQFEIKRI